jgi:hypothetical protein
MPVVYIVMPISLFVMILHGLDALVAELGRPREEGS